MGEFDGREDVIEMARLQEALNDRSIEYVMVTTVHEWGDKVRAIGISPKSAQALREDDGDDLLLKGTKTPVFMLIQRCDEDGQPDRPMIVVRKLIVHDNAFNFLHATLVGIERLSKNMQEYIDWTPIDPEDEERTRILLECLTERKDENALV